MFYLEGECVVVDGVRLLCEVDGDCIGIWGTFYSWGIAGIVWGCVFGVITADEREFNWVVD